MSHLYKLVQNNNEHMQEAYQKWYARPVYTGTLDLNGIAELIQRNSTAKKSDALAVLTEMVEVISDALKSSQRVKIDGFGTFKVGMASKGVSSVKRLLKGLSFAPAASLVNAKEVEERGKDVEPEP